MSLQLLVTRNLDIACVRLVEVLQMIREEHLFAAELFDQGSQNVGGFLYVLEVEVNEGDTDLIVKRIFVGYCFENEGSGEFSPVK